MRVVKHPPQLLDFIIILFVLNTFHHTLAFVHARLRVPHINRTNIQQQSRVLRLKEPRAVCTKDVDVSAGFFINDEPHEVVLDVGEEVLVDARPSEEVTAVSVRTRGDGLLLRPKKTHNPRQNVIIAGFEIAAGEVG